MTSSCPSFISEQGSLFLEGVYHAVAIAFLDKDALCIFIHAFRHRIFRLIADTGAAGRTDLAGDRHHMGGNALRRQRAAGPQRREMSVECSNVVIHEK